MTGFDACVRLFVCVLRRSCDRFSLVVGTPLSGTRKLAPPGVCILIS